MNKMKKVNYLSILYIGLLMSVISGCTSYPAYEITDELFVNRSYLNMLIGEQIKITASPADVPLTWTSSDEDVVTVNQTGLVTGVGEGLAEIFVTQGTSRTSVPVNVDIPTVDRVFIAGLENSSKMWIAIETLSDRVETVRIFWNSDRDSMDFAVNNRIVSMIDTIVYSGNDYIFHVVSIDRLGNRSRASEIVPRFVRNRNIVLAFDNEGVITIKWGDGNIEYIDHCLVSYVNLDGLPVSRIVYPAEMTTVINDYASGLSYATVFVPTSTDTIRVADSSLEISQKQKLDKTGWIATASDQDAASGNVPANTVDNNYSSVWHSQWTPSTVPLPHWIMIDMKKECIATRIETRRRSSASYTKTLMYYISNTPTPSDLSVWTKIAEGMYPSNTGDNLLTLDITGLFSGRYLLLYLVDSHSGQNCTVAEIDVYGYN
jgi:hypothetical protein